MNMARDNCYYYIKELQYIESRAKSESFWIVNDKID